jgi:integrase/recombinase XerD
VKTFISLQKVGGLDRGPLCPHIGRFVTLGKEQGYKLSTLVRGLRVIAGLNRWLRRNGRKAGDLDEATIQRFLLRRFGGKPTSGGQSSTLRRLLGQMRAAGEAREMPRLVGSEITEAFRSFLRKERGLAVGTVYQYTREADRFLRSRFRPARVGDITGRDLGSFIRHWSNRSGGHDNEQRVAALRAFCRYLHYSGRHRQNLAATVPHVARWSMANIPRGLPERSVEEVLRGGWDRRTATGRRDRAILLLLARLGLRAREVLLLTLDDIDWDAGLLTIRSPKNGQATRLPLPADAAAAIVKYLQRDRPRCACRRLFLRVIAPHTGLSASAVISMLVNKALATAGVKVPRGGAHLFRHSLATTMFRHGASLPEIGQVLRHRHVLSTAIYAKVDLDTLRSIAQPWPGGVR